MQEEKKKPVLELSLKSFKPTFSALFRSLFFTLQHSRIPGFPSSEFKPKRRTMHTERMKVVYENIPKKNSYITLE